MFGKYDKDALIKNYKEALKNADFKKLVDSFDISDEIKMKHTSSFEESCHELNNCKNCKGLAFCKNKIEGFVYYPNVNGNILKLDYVACKKKKKVLAEESACDFYDLPDTLKNISMKDIEIDDSRRVPIIKWLKNFYDSYEKNPNQKGLYLYGSFGCGKTFMITAMLNELSKKNVDIVAVYYPEMLRSLKDAFDEGTFSSRINRLKKCDVLLLDDIGAESVTAWGRDEILGTILQYRMDEKLPTFFTSNLSLKELEVHLASTKNGDEKVKARRIIERIKQLTMELDLISENRRK